MKKTIILYIFMILFIAVLTVLMNIPFVIFSFVTFPRFLHVGLESIISIILFLIFLKGRNLYSKTGDERFLILALGFLVGLLFNLVHVFNMTVYPYDSLSFNNIKNNPTLFYLLVCNLIIPLCICFSVIYKPLHKLSREAYKFKIYNTYFCISSAIVISSILVYFFLSHHLNKVYLIIHSLEYVNYALFLMLAAILINSGFNSKKSHINMFTIGLLVLGFGGLFYINPLMSSFNGIIAHVFSLLGVSLILLGLSNLEFLAASLRMKDEIVTYLSLLLIIFYIMFIPIASGIYHVEFPQYAGYMFVELLLIFQFFLYVFSKTSLNKMTSVYLLGERNRVLVRIHESMRRISNQNIIKNTIINEINKDFNADKCYIVLYDSENKKFSYDKYVEKLPSNTLADTKYLDEEALRFERFCEIFNNNIGMSFESVDEYIFNNVLKGTEKEQLLREYNIKSYFSVPINYYDKFLGYLILEYIQKPRKLDGNDFSYLKELVVQIAISMSK